MDRYPWYQHYLEAKSCELLNQPFRISRHKKASQFKVPLFNGWLEKVMAKLKLKLNENVEGNYYVDSTCIDCSACRRFAPSTFGDGDEFAFVKAQPGTEAEVLAANQALISCPTASIGTIDKTDLNSAKSSFPIELVPGIYINGFNKKDSYGADSYFIKSDLGNWLVDSPRFTQHLVKKFERLGGVDYIFLTHQDDVADAHLYANHFQAKRIIHQLDSSAQKDAEIILQGEEGFSIGQGRIIFTPGHTAGHLVLLWEERYLFTGDHFAWLRRLNRWGSFRDACWDSWKKQINSVAKLKVLKDVQWIFPGHGSRGEIQQEQFPDVIDDAVAWMKSVQVTAT